jgi:uncharacterized protein YndB with AHSA1/START domain
MPRPLSLSGKTMQFVGGDGTHSGVPPIQGVEVRKLGSSAHTDTYHGHFVQLVPNERVVEVDEFETTDPAWGGEMTITIMLSDADDGGTELTAEHASVPPGVSAADNALVFPVPVCAS